MAHEIHKVSAVLNMQPPGPPRAYVGAVVMVPDLGSSAKLVKREPQGINRRILILDVVVSPSGGPSGEQVVDVEVRYEEDPAEESYETAELHYADNVGSERFEIVA